MKRFALRALDVILRGHLAAHWRLKSALAEPSTAKPYRLKSIPTDASIQMAHVNGNFLVGGTTQLMIDLIERLSDTYAQEVVVPDAPDPLPYEPVALLIAPLTELTALFQAWSQQRPALVHVQYWVREGDEFHPLALWYDAVFRMCERLGIPVIQNVNVPTVPHASPAIVHNVYVSRYVRDEYDPGHVPASVVYPGSDFSHFSRDDAPPDEVIGMVYRLERDKLDEKSIEVFIEAVRRRPGLHCLIVGGGYYLELYQRRVAEEGMTASFTFTGYVSYDDLPSLYRRLSIFVAPVHNESFGQVTPFAMSMGLPVAGFDIGALGEQLGGSETLASPGNVGQLADIIIDLCEHRDRRLASGDANRQRAQDLFSVDAMAEHYRALYGDVMRSAGRPVTHSR